MTRLLTRVLPALAALLCATAALAQADHPKLPDGADPNDWNAYFDRGMQLMNRDGVGAADELFAWASRLDPSRAEPLYARWAAFHMRDLRRFMDYLDDNERVLRDPRVRAADSLAMTAFIRNPFVHRGVAALVYQQLPGDWRTDSFTRAYLEYARGHIDAAAQGLQARLRAMPGDVAARQALALTLVNLRRYDEARVELDSVLAAARRRDERRVTRVYESKAMLLYSIGLLALAQNRPADAREVFAQAVLEDASQWYVHRGLAMALMAEGRAAEGLAEYRTALELAPADPVLLNEYGRALFAAGQFPAAVEQLAKAVQLAPDWANGWLDLGNARMRAGDTAGAIQAFDGYLARAPRSDAATADRIRAQVERMRAGGPGD
jgi:Flp pilus assembly protein TadD